MALPEIKVRISADPRDAVAGLRQVDAAIDRTEVNAKAAAGSVGRLGSGMSTLGKSSGGLSQSLSGVTQQLSQVGQQTMATGNFVQELAIQLPDIGLAFGVVGTAVGLVAGIALPMLMSAFGGAGVKAKELQDATDALSDAFGAYQAAAGNANLTTDEMIARFGTLGPQMRIVFDQMLEFERATAMDAMGAAVASLTDQFGVLGTAQSDVLTIGATGFTDSEMAASRMAHELGFAYEQGLLVVDALMAIQNAEGIDEQVSAARGFSEALISTFGSAEAIPPELREAARAASEAASMAAEINAELEAAAYTGASLVDVVGGVSGALAPAIGTAQNLAAAMWDAAAGAAAVAANRMMDLAQGDDERGSQRESLSDVQSLRSSQAMRTANRRASAYQSAAVQTSGGGVSSGGGASGGASRGNPELERLIDDLKTEREIVDEWRAESLVLLNEAGAAELEALGGMNDAKLRLEEEYQERLARIKEAANNDALGSILSGGGEILAAIGETNDRALAMSKAFAAGEALVNAYRAASQVLADPSIPFWGKFTAVASTIAAGIKMVNAIKSINKGGTGGGGIGGGAATSAQAPMNVQYASIHLQGDSFSRQSVKGLLDQIQSGIDGGYKLRLNVA